MADQSIASTASPGHITLPDGRVVPTLDTWFNQQANNPQGAGVAEQRTALGQGYSQNVAKPLTDMLGNFLTDPLRAAEGIGLVDKEGPVGTTGRAITQSIAKTVIPQDLTQAGIDIGTLAGGGVPKGFQVAGRMLGGTMGGALGGAADYTDTTKGALTGAGRGLVQAGAGEGIGAVADYARKMGVERATRKIQEIDAAQFTKAMKANPKLQGVFDSVPETSDGLHDLLKGAVRNAKSPEGLAKNKADALLGEKLDAYDKVIGDAIAAQRAQGRQYLLPDLKNPGTTTTWEKARESLTELGRIARRAKSGTTYQYGDQTLAGDQIKQLYADGLRAYQRELAYVDGLHGTTTLQTFNQAREMEAAAQYYLKALDTAFATKTEGRRAFNSNRVQDFMDKGRKSQVEGMNRLGEDQFWEMAGAVRLDPKRIGQVDVYQPHGIMSQAAGIVPGPAGAYMRFHVGSPQLVGSPLQMAPGSRTGMNLGASQLMSPGGQMGQEMVMQQQGIPGLGR